MIILTYIDGISRKDVGDQLFEKLLAIYPEGQAGSAGHMFRSKLPTDDQRTQKMLQVLQNAGFESSIPGVSNDQTKRSFDIRFHREYSMADLAECELLELRALDGAFHGAERSETGEMSILEWLLPSERGLAAWDFVSGYTEKTWIFSPTHVKARLSAEKLEHLQWKAIRFWPNDVGPTEDWQGVQKRVGIPYWELDSDVTLPPVSSSMDLRDRCGNRVEPGQRRIDIVRHEGQYAYPELHYRQSDLANLPPFDVARTYENFGLVSSQEFMPDYSSIVVSQKFRQMCLQNGLKADWIPVRIDLG